VHRSFDEYATRYRHVHMRREDGVLELRLHTDDGPLVWGAGPHSELGFCWADVGADPDNRVVVLTGTGEEFCTRIDDSWNGPMTPAKWDRIYANGKRLLRNLLDIEVPVIAAVNGPARVHAELAVLADIVLASEDTVFQDLPHFRFGTVPGDGVHVVWQQLLGPNRGRQFLLLGTKLDAEEALRLGVVAEVLPRDRLLERAWEIARLFAAKPDPTLRYARVALTMPIKRALADHVSHGLAVEGLSAHETWPQ
jgi:enoyl-CoA hydratase/carnithine racemase